MPKSSSFEPSDLQFDREHIWHPYTSLTKPLPVYPVVGAKGVHLQLADGTQLIDGMSSWWAAIHGYNHPALNEAIAAQVPQMSHVMFGGITHQPAIQLARLLVQITPEGLDRVFLCDSGSISVEVAMKVAIQYQHALKKPHKSKFLTFRKGYHGDTTAAMSVCDPISGMHHLFKDFMPKHHFAPEPPNGFQRPITAEETKQLSDFFAQHAEEAAAFIFEPIVQGAGGMRIYSPDYLKLLRQLCDQHEILLIADEIATGFGRTGKLFAVEHAAITPDIICIGKAITGGYMTLAAMLCTKQVAHTICNGEAGVLMHGPTFMGNPLACAVAIASICLLLDTSWEVQIAQIQRILEEELRPIEAASEIKAVRVLGAIGILECTQTVNVSAAQRFFVEQGVWVRPFRNLIYIMPPYIISTQQLQTLCTVLKAALKEDIWQ